MALGLISLDPGRGFWVNLSVALGFVGLALMGLQFVLAARFPATTTFGIDIVLQVPRPEDTRPLTSVTEQVVLQ